MYMILLSRSEVGEVEQYPNDDFQGSWLRMLTAQCSRQQVVSPSDKHCL